MSEDEVRAVIEETRALKRMQETPDSPEALATIPDAALKDLPAQNALIPIETGKLAGADLVTHDLPANGIVYLDLGFDLRRLPADLLPYMGIFCRALLETGTAKQDFVALSQQIGRVTGGIAAQRWTSAALGSDQAAALAVPALEGDAGEDRRACVHSPGGAADLAARQCRAHRAAHQ